MLLEVVSHLFVLTHDGEREIQLCVGDITKLPASDKVDVILISALPNNYTPTRGSVIGALKRNLGLSVMKLAYHHKKEDLRVTCNCWLSKALPESMPYRQLLCYEKAHGKGGTLMESVEDLFRAMMPIFNNQNHTVITPLLCSHIQRVSQAESLWELVRQSVTWMKAGLPMQCFKIVIYDVNPRAPSRKTLECIELFEKAKEKFLKHSSIPKVPPIKIDVLLIFSGLDQELAKLVQKMLKREDPQVRIRTALQNKDSLQQISSSQKVVPLLTAAFLNDAECISLYNMALCCNRWTKRLLMAPLYLDVCHNLPSYMGLVQWFNCKPRNEYKMQEACVQLIEELAIPPSLPLQRKYDVFISYSHKNLGIAKQVLQYLQELDPELRIFFDYEELKTGTSWQQTLYNSVDRSRSLLALISPEYVDSSVCTEEFNLALAKHLGKRVNPMQLVPLMIKETEQQPFMDHVSCATLENVTCRDSRLKDVCVSLLHFLKTTKKDINIPSVQETVEIDSVAEEERNMEFENHYEVCEEGLQFSRRDATPCEVAATRSYTIYFSNVASDQKYVEFLCKWLMTYVSNVTFLSSCNGNGIKDIEGADTIVVFLSRKYLRSSKDIEEFQFILNRARVSTQDGLFYPIVLQQLPEKPLYARLVQTRCHLEDDLWIELTKSIGLNNVAENLVAEVGLTHGRLGSSEAMALIKAACDLREYIRGAACLPDARPNKSILRSVLSVYNNVHWDQHDDKISLSQSDDAEDEIGDMPPLEGLYHLPGDLYLPEQPGSKRVSNATDVSDVYEDALQSVERKISAESMRTRSCILL